MDYVTITLLKLRLSCGCPFSAKKSR